ncbi:MAG TPA: molybdopterin oxidoreductase family protein [Solirubrobacteraceae bacterium]|jgi:anaerobic selenocysteine-containing dehydrogenase|nr:molybdopterin oxidoreductase family protein [Solirubrobacteraceae bacterium]
MVATADVHHRTCTLCEAMCGLEIRHAGEDILSIRGDAENTFSRGHICAKGAALADVHSDPDRIRFPLRRTQSGWERVDWDDALDDIAARVGAIQREHGDDAVGLYAGNPTVHHLGAQLLILPLIVALRTRNRFSATSLDQLPQQLATFELFGHQAMFPVPDIDRTEFFLCLGGNPLASGGSLMTAPGMRHRIRELQARGGRFVVVDPRRTESAAVADQHLPIRPGTDAWLLLAMLHVIFAEGLADLGRVAAFTDGIATLAEHAARFSPREAAARTGIPAHDITELARAFAGADRAIAYARVGICQQAFGGLAAWLVYALGIVTGNLDREGGMMFTTPAVDPLPLTAGHGPGGSFDAHRSRVSGLPEFSGEFPAACLAEEIETPGRGQIRGLLVHAGNPVLSAPNGRRLERALPGLDLLVCFDYYVTETSSHADYILPPASPLETSEYDVALSLLTVRNVAHFSPPMFDPPEGARHDWQALAGLIVRLHAGRGLRGRAVGWALGVVVERLGVEGLLDVMIRSGPYGHGASFARALEQAMGATGVTRAAWRHLLALATRGPWRGLLAAPSSQRPQGARATGLTLRTLKAHVHGLDLGPLERRLPERLFTPGKRIRLVPEIYLAELERLRAAGEDPMPGADALVLIGRRQVRSNNSWMHNSARLVKGKSRCTLMIHPRDATSRGLADGGSAVVSSRVGEVTLPVEVTETMMPGVVSIPHGWGHDREDSGWRTARAHPGVSANDITDDGFLDGLTGTAAFNGVPVQVRALAASEAVPSLAG